MATSWRIASRCYPRPLDDTGHGVEGRKFPNPVVQIASLHPEFLFRPPPVRDIVYDDDEPVVLWPVCPQLVVGVDIRAVDLAVHRRPGPRNPPAEVERNRTDRRDSRDEVFPGNLIPPAPESLFSLAVDLDDPEPGRFPEPPRMTSSSSPTSSIWSKRRRYCRSEAVVAAFASACPTAAPSIAAAAATRSRSCCRTGLSVSTTRCPTVLLPAMIGTVILPPPGAAVPGTTRIDTRPGF